LCFSSKSKRKKEVAQRLCGRERKSFLHTLPHGCRDVLQRHAQIAKLVCVKLAQIACQMRERQGVNRRERVEQRRCRKELTFISSDQTALAQLVELT
jgi:hypothetical protein